MVTSNGIDIPAIKLINLTEGLTCQVTISSALVQTFQTFEKLLQMMPMIG
jgi:hypothetical protein